MTKGLSEFVHKYPEMYQDASWRAYDIPASVTEAHELEALKYLGIDTTELSIARAEVVAAFGLNVNPLRAGQLLREWWLWRRIASGRKVNGLVRRSTKR